MLQNGAGINAAAIQAGVNRVTVYRLQQKYAQTGSVRNRPKYLVDQGQLPLPRTAVSELQPYSQRFQSSVKICSHLRQATGLRIHPRTVRNRLKAAGIKPRRSCVRNVLTPRHMRERLAWCRHRRRWRRNQWGNILFTDESRFNLDSCDRRRRVWRRRDERYAPATIAEHDRFGGGSILVWAGISYNHKTDLVIVDGNMTAAKYRDEILTPIVEPLVNRTGLTFQDDNARPHRARIVTEYVQRQGIPTIPWPARSADLADRAHWTAHIRRTATHCYSRSAGSHPTSRLAGNPSEIYPERYKQYEITRSRVYCK